MFMHAYMYLKLRVRVWDAYEQINTPNGLQLRYTSMRQLPFRCNVSYEV